MSQASIESKAKYLSMVVEMMKMGDITIKMIGEFVKSSDESQEFKDSIAAQFEEMYLECRFRVEKAEYEGTEKEVNELKSIANLLVAEARKAKERFIASKFAQNVASGKIPPPPPSPAKTTVEKGEEKTEVTEEEAGSSWSKVVKKSAKKAELKIKASQSKDAKHSWSCEIFDEEGDGVCDCVLSKGLKPAAKEVVAKEVAKPVVNIPVPAAVVKRAAASNVGKLTAMFEKKKVSADEEESVSTKVVAKVNAKRVVDPERVNVNTPHAYSNYIKQGMRPCMNRFACTRSKCDFLHIDEDALCETTYTGDVCKNVNVRNEAQRCDKIHIKRCRDNEDCKRKNCTFLHGHEMNDQESARRFKHSMDEYSEFVY